MSSFVGYLDSRACNSCINTRTTNLIDVIRDVKIKIRDNKNIIDDSITDEESKFLRDYYNVSKFNYVIIPNELLDTYLNEMEVLSETKRTGIRIVKHTDKDTGEVTEERHEYDLKYVEIKLVPDTSNNHQIYIIKNSTVSDMLTIFKDESKGGIKDLQTYYKDNSPRVTKPKKDKSVEKEKPHVQGKTVQVKHEENETANKPAKGSAAKNSKGSAAKGTAAKGSSAKGTAAKGSTAKGTAAKGSSAKGTAASVKNKKSTNNNVSDVEQDPDKAGEDENSDQNPDDINEDEGNTSDNEQNPDDIIEDEENSSDNE